MIECDELMRWMNQMIEWDEWMRRMNEKNEWDKMKEWDESLWWKLKFIIVIKVHLDDEKSALWWRLIMSAEIHHNDADNWTEWWKMILQMKIYHSDENISQCWSLSLVDLRSPHWPNKLCFTNSGCIRPFWYFPGCVGGWVGGGKIKNK